MPATASFASVPTGGQAVVGPIVWQPADQHECLMVVVECDDDRALTQDLVLNGDGRVELVAHALLERCLELLRSELFHTAQIDVYAHDHGLEAGGAGEAWDALV